MLLMPLLSRKVVPSLVSATQSAQKPSLISTFTAGLFLDIAGVHCECSGDFVRFPDVDLGAASAVRSSSCVDIDLRSHPVLHVGLTLITGGVVLVAVVGVHWMLNGLTILGAKLLHLRALATVSAVVSGCSMVLPF